ncbi:flagellar basal body P-ring formation chaperone FlgA [Phorcysia thermohydrogeniphila]|uniref:flagellar basal body P-ring formation chaperone FlgA n=1 Tax=Phorcysia thermohydrogeniphila TaxID=936138 RepID=UPI001FB1A5A9|nr:flagellar basal body P-ring formation chaperone FlgA [Phorcysia thermohydrogeniphila]
MLLLFQVAFAAEVVLKNDVKVSGEKVFLKDVADIRGAPAEVQLLSDIFITSSPPPCRERTLSKKRVAERIVRFLEENGISFKEIRVTGPSLIRMTRPCVRLDRERVKAAVVEFFNKNYPDYVVLSVSAPSVAIPYEHFEERISLDSLGDRYARVKYEILVKGVPIRKFWIPVRIDKKVEVVVAARDIPKGKVISPSDLKKEKLPSLKVRRGALTFESVIGKVAKRDIRAGEVIKGRDLEPNFVVKKGKPVKLIYESGGIHVELLAVALENGAVGDIIKVKNVSTGKVLVCKVIGENTVKFLLK